MCKVTSKACITITSTLFWGVAAGLIFIGAWVYKEYKHYDEIADSLYTLVPATIFMAVGVFFFLLGIVGCVGACKEQRCLLGLFFTILLIVLVGMVTAGVFGYVKRADVDEAIQNGIWDGMKKYNTSGYTTMTHQIDFMQEELKCCGLHNYTDWSNSDIPYKRVPNSCCMHNNCSSNKTAFLPQSLPLRNNGTGCYEKLKDQFQSHLGVIAGVASGFTAILILGMIFSCVLVCTRRSEVPYIGLSNEQPNGMRV